MNIDIIEKEILIDLYGFSGMAIGKDYTGTAFRLMDKMWEIVKSKKLQHNGKNVWVYEANDQIFAGVELKGSFPVDTGLEHKCEFR